MMMMMLFPPPRSLWPGVLCKMYTDTHRLGRRFRSAAGAPPHSCFFLVLPLCLLFGSFRLGANPSSCGGEGLSSSVGSITPFFRQLSDRVEVLQSSIYNCCLVPCVIRLRVVVDFFSCFLFLFGFFD